ncbi:MAG TPA: DUF1345 domain-containing protein [Candidatus Limnocylindrales bacterium]
MAARATELVLAGYGLGFTILGNETEKQQAQFLATWGALAICYLVIGGRHARRLRTADGPEDSATADASSVTGRRLGFLLSAAASLTGLGAALDVLSASGEDYGELVHGLGVIVMVCAWLLLHAGYARFYAHWDKWRFPGTSHPGLVDFLYFSFTIGVSFAASDVEVQSRALRWHVMVHAIISFFYNAIVLAVAVSIITG